MAAARAKPARLPAAIGALRALYGAVPTEAGSAWKQILWENCCYLAGNERRSKAFATLERRTRLDPARILAAPDAVLREVTSAGILAERFIDKLRQCAQLALDSHAGDMDAALAAMAPEAARRALRRFPGIGEPGAEKILLHAGLFPTPALDSNGLRVLERLGYIKEDTSYARQWKAARDVVARETPADAAGWIELYTLLRRHGQIMCKRSNPHCGECPLAGAAVGCPFPAGSAGR